ncbi:MAG: heat-inducible transcriptional repressor HrcA [Acidobacteriota bacterium]
MSARNREILKDIIRTHVSTGEPVSSRTVSKHEHGLSAASIRNIMADLEDAGLLSQPHTSAGRVPTERAYRVYIESLMSLRQLSEEDRRLIDDRLDGAEGDELIARVGELLSELSHQAAVVLTPGIDDVILRSAEFVPLGGRRVLCVLVADAGFVDHVVVDTDIELAREDLVRFSNYVTEHYAGLRVQEIHRRLLCSLAEERRDVDTWLTDAMAFAQRAMSEGSSRQVLVQGATSLLDRPELSDVDRVRQMLDTFADRARLTNMLSSCLESDGGVRVFMGEDSEITRSLDFSLVAMPYGHEDTPLGSLGVIGPSRMEYPRVVPLVRYLGETLSRALTTSDR